jgi:hypothetical protein
MTVDGFSQISLPKLIDEVRKAQAMSNRDEKTDSAVDRDRCSSGASLAQSAQ